MRTLAVTIALIESLIIPGSLIGQRRECRETRNPKQLPSPGSLIDSAAAVAQLAALSEPSDTMIFSLFFSDSDSIPRVRAVLGADATAAVALARFVRPQKPDLWGIRVRIVKGASRALTLERSMYCPPRPPPVVRGPSPVTLVLPQLGESPPRRGRIVIQLEVLVSEYGEPLNVKITESSGMKDLDDAIVRDWQAKRFEPAQLDGYPLKAVYRTDGASPRL